MDVFSSTPAVRGQLAKMRRSVESFLAEKLDAFMQAYSVEKARIEARKKGYAVSEQELPSGSIKVEIIEGS